MKRVRIVSLIILLITSFVSLDLLINFVVFLENVVLAIVEVGRR